MPTTARLGRPALILTLACAVVLAAPASGAKLTKRNSISAEFLLATSFELQGVGCGSTATNSVTAAKARKGVSKAFRFEVRKPKVGDREGYVRVSGVAVNDQTVTVTAVADAAQCTAQASGPPAQEAWSATFAPDISFFRRIQARVRPDLLRKRPLLKPRTLRPGGGETLKRIRWKRYGGKTASGTATYDENLPGVKVKRGAKITLRRIRRCLDFGLYEYTTLKIVHRGRTLVETGNTC